MNAGTPNASSVEESPLRPITVLRLNGFVVTERWGTDVYAFCGHRWNVYGYLPEDMLRYPHCWVCRDAGVSHLVILTGWLFGRQSAGLRARYRGSSTCGRCPGGRSPDHACWRVRERRRRQWAAVRRYIDATIANGTAPGNLPRPWGAS